MHQTTKFAEYFFRCGLNPDADLDVKRQKLPEGMQFFSTSELYDGAGLPLRSVENLGIADLH
jgi:hypothetical protein